MRSFYGLRTTVRRHHSAYKHFPAAHIFVSGIPRCFSVTEGTSWRLPGTGNVLVTSPLAQPLKSINVHQQLLSPFFCFLNGPVSQNAATDLSTSSSNCLRSSRSIVTWECASTRVSAFPSPNAISSLVMLCRRTWWQLSFPPASDRRCGRCFVALLTRAAVLMSPVCFWHEHRVLDQWCPR